MSLPGAKTLSQKPSCFSDLYPVGTLKASGLTSQENAFAAREHNYSMI